MAVTWDIEISNVNLQSGRGTVRATRTDSESALEPRTYTLSNTPMQDSTARLKILNTIKEWDETAVSNAAAIESFIDGLEQSAKVNLEAWEETR